MIVLHLVQDRHINLVSNAFLNEPVSPFPGWLVLNGGYSKGCTLRGQEETKHALVTSKVHLHSHSHLLSCLPVTTALPQVLCLLSTQV